MLRFVRNRSQKLQGRKLPPPQDRQKSAASELRLFLPALCREGWQQQLRICQSHLQKSYDMIATQNAIRIPLESNSSEATGSSWNPHSKKMSQP